MCEKKVGNVLTNARLNFSQSEASLLLMRGGIKLCAPTVVGGGGGNKHIPKNLRIGLKNVQMNFEKLASTWTCRYLLILLHIFKYARKIFSSVGSIFFFQSELANNFRKNLWLGSQLMKVTSSKSRTFRSKCHSVPLSMQKWRSRASAAI